MKSRGFSVVRRAIADQLPAGEPFRAVLDDSLLNAASASWISAAMPGKDGAFRLAPVALLHAPTPPKPCSKATVAEVKQYRLDAGSSRLSHCAEKIPARTTCINVSATLSGAPAASSRFFS